MNISAGEEFRGLVAFHGCYCPDIAMGFRIAKAMQREMAESLADMKSVYARVGVETCAVDAMQYLLGCTAGKRNLIFDQTGKAVFIIQNVTDGQAVRVYCHYWQQFDHQAFVAAKRRVKSEHASEQDRQALQDFLDSEIEKILTLDEVELFSLERVDVASPARQGKFKSVTCDSCAEDVAQAYVVEQEGRCLCPECK